MICISIDPGMSGTGVAVWDNGKCVALTTIYPRKDGTDIDRATDLIDKLTNLFSDHVPTFKVAVEAFSRFHDDGVAPGRKALDMMKCSVIRGICVGVAYQWADYVIDVSKGKAPKSDAVLLARSMGFAEKKTSKHSRDALHLGICAGFDRRKA